MSSACLSLHSQTCGLGLLETEIGAALCAIGAGGAFGVSGHPKTIKKFTVGRPSNHLLTD